MATGGATRDEWREAFRTEARRRGLPGREIREALAEVEAYCAGSTADPADAFGEPATYAAELAAGWRAAGAAGRRHGRRRRRLVPLVVAGSLAGVTSLLAGVDALTTGQGRGVVTLGQLVSTTAGIAGITLVAAALYRAGRRVRPDWRFGLAGAVGVGVTALPQLFWTRPVLRASGWLLVGIGLLLVTLAWWPLVSGWLFADRATGPAAAGESSQARRRLLRVVRWSLPVALLCAVLLALLIGDTGLVVG